MGRSNRWAYMANPNFNPPNNDCPDCSEPSKTYHQGSRTTFDDKGQPLTKSTRYACEHHHAWTVEEPR